jgi:hypothetical protein
LVNRLLREPQEGVLRRKDIDTDGDVDDVEEVRYDRTNFGERCGKLVRRNGCINRRMLPINEYKLVTLEAE